MAETCPNCQASVAAGDHFCRACRTRLYGGDSGPQAGPASDRAAFCAMCGLGLVPEASHCSECGAPVSDVAPAPRHGEAAARERTARAAKAEEPPPRRFEVLWMVKSIGLIVLCCLGLMLLVRMLEHAGIIGEAGAGNWLLAAASLGVFAGAFWAAKRSPGRTVIEPAAGAVFLFFVFFAAMGLTLGESLAVSLPTFLFGLLGGRLGERSQGKKHP